MTLDQWEVLTRLFLNLAVGVVILAGGAWALTIFTALGDWIHSKAELQNLELHRQLKEFRRLQQEEQAGESVDISIRAEPVDLPGDPFKYVAATVQIANQGMRASQLMYDEDRKPLKVFQVCFSDDGRIVYENCAGYPVPLGKAPNNRAPGILVPAGGCEKIPFVFRLRSPGVYLLVFSAHAGEEEPRGMVKSAGNWVGKEYLVVK